VKEGGKNVGGGGHRLRSFVITQVAWRWCCWSARFARAEVQSLAASIRVSIRRTADRARESAGRVTKETEANRLLQQAIAR
jgi:hypothetical protein